MPTSDAFSKKKREEDRPSYLVLGAGGIQIARPSGILYDSAAEEAMAFYYALRIHCKLYRRNPDRKIFEVVFPGEYREVDRKMSVGNNRMNKDMMNNNTYVEGIQVSSY